jgi:magnesium transporter
MVGTVEGESARVVVPLGDVSAVETALRSGDDKALRQAVRRVRPADLGRDLSRHTMVDNLRILGACEDRYAAAMLRAAHPSIAASLLASCHPGNAARLLTFMPTEVQATVLGFVPADVRDAIEKALPAEDRKSVDRILAHPKTAVGRLMTFKIWSAPRTATVEAALAALRDKAADIEVASNCYVVDADGKLAGVVPLRELAVAPPAEGIEALMTRDPISVPEDLDRGDAAEIIRTHNFLSLPVVDSAGKLAGAVRVDDLLDDALSKTSAGMLNQGGVAGRIAAQVPYFQTPLWKVVRSRITWLILLFVAETATGTVLRHFEDELAKVVALSFFIPLLIGTGGNAGSQTVSTVIRALALGEVRLGDALRVLAKEVSAGLVLGVLLGGIAFGRALLWGVGYDLAACVAVTVLVVCTWANTVGALIPIGAQKLGIDPTVISGPLITTLVDASGLFLYLTIAHVMIAQLHG